MTSLPDREWFLEKALMPKINPYQHPVVINESPSSTPERALLAAILERAILDACCTYVEKKSLFRSCDRASALQWLLSDEEDTFSFVWVARHLQEDWEALVIKVREIIQDELSPSRISFVSMPIRRRVA